MMKGATTINAMIEIKQEIICDKCGRVYSIPEDPKTWWIVCAPCKHTLYLGDGPGDKPKNDTVEWKDDPYIKTSKLA